MNMQTGKLLGREKIENPSPVFMRCEQPCPYWRSPTQAISLKTSVLRNTQGFPEILLIEENHFKNTSRILGPYVNVNSPWFSPDGTHWSAMFSRLRILGLPFFSTAAPIRPPTSSLFRLSFPPRSPRDGSRMANVITNGIVLTLIFQVRPTSKQKKNKSSCRNIFILPA